MRKLILLVCMSGVAASVFLSTTSKAGIIPTLEAASGKIGFYPISNEISYYKNVDDSGADRGTTLQVVSINSFRLWTTFSFEFTADFNYDLTPGLSDDHYIELSLVKPIGALISLNVQRVLSSFEDKPINQFGIRLGL